jgi:hypothetical protein
MTPTHGSTATTDSLEAQRAWDHTYLLGWYEDPRWPAWKGEGAISVQLQGGLLLDALSTDTQVQIVPAAHGKTDVYGTLRMRIGSTAKSRAPVWADFPIKMHRPLPKGSIIKRVTVHRTLGGAKTANAMSGRREHWEAQFVIEMPLPDPRHGKGIVGVDLGWRRIGGELRVCAFADEEDGAGELRLSERTIGGVRRVDSLRKTRDDMRNRALGLLIAMRPLAPRWFRDETEHAHAWRNPSRIPMLLAQWRKQRWAGDEDGFQWLSFWLERDRHLWQWEADQRRKNVNGRRKFYEGFAAKLAETYETLVLEDFDLRTFARRPAKDAIVGPDGRKESQQEEAARAWRHLAGTYELRLVLENAFLTRGGTVSRVPAANTTRTCADCGLIVRRDFAGSIEWTCDCGVVHDQDKNAGVILCESFRKLEREGIAKVRKSGKRKVDMESRFVRAKKRIADLRSARAAANSS